jgi:hypothetical protein
MVNIVDVATAGHGWTFVHRDCFSGGLPAADGRFGRRLLSASLWW